MILRRKLACSIALSIVFAALVGCSEKTNTVVVQGASKNALLDPFNLQQFATPLPIIPVATPDTTSFPGQEYYVVSAEETENYDFGLRNQDGSEIINPATGQGIRTTVWGYTTNGIKAGYLGASIEARSTLAANTVAAGKKVRVKYINNLKSSSGILAKHLLAVDPTIGGTTDMNGRLLPEIRIVTHLHGGHVLPQFDGHPMAWVTNDPNYSGAAASGDTPARPGGNSFTYIYDNDQLAAHLWFHDHAMGVTRLNVYAGLAANYLLRDDHEDALGLPRGAYEIPLVIQDKSFNQDGSLHYDSNALLNSSGTRETDSNGNPVYSSKPEFFGNVITVNGKAWPYLNVEKRKYRFRMLNGSDSRFYNMWLESKDANGNAVAVPAGAITQVGSEAGLLPNKVIDIGRNQSSALLLSTGERADIIVDFDLFPLNTTITLRNDAATPFPMGTPVDDLAVTSKIMQFRVSANAASTTNNGATPANPRAKVSLAASTNTRYLDLQEGTDGKLVFDPFTGTTSQRLKLRLNGLDFNAPITELPALSSTEDWVIINDTVDMHPIHLHLVAFEVLEKGTVAGNDYTPADGLGGMPIVNPGDLRPNIDTNGDPVGTNSHYTVQPQELGWKETVRVPPKDEVTGRRGYVKVRAKFDIAGIYMWHCHILAHEEHEMMRPFRVVGP